MAAFKLSSTAAQPSMPTHANAEDFKGRLEREQIRLLYEQAPIGIFTAALVGSIMVLVTWEWIAKALLLSWLTILELALLCRYLLVQRFRSSTPKDANDNLDRWGTWYTWACGVTGATWGSSVLLLMFCPSLPHQLFIACVLLGVATGGLLTMIPVLCAYTAYALLTLLPPITWLLLQGEAIYLAIGTLGILYTVLLFSTARYYHNALLKSLRLALEDKALVDSLSESQLRTEQAKQILEQEQALQRDSEDAIRELYQLTSETKRNSQEKIQALLAMGCRRFGMGIGILSHVHDARYEVAAAFPAGSGIAQGDVYELGETYCREALQAKAPIAFERASSTERRNHPAYIRFKLEAYLGTPVIVNGQVYGTLNFSSPTPRAIPFTAMDREILQLMAQWIGGVIEQDYIQEESRHHQAMLAHATKLSSMGEMAASLAHELNQPMTAIATYSEACLTGLRNDTLDRDTILDALEKIAAQSSRAGAIIRRTRSILQKGKIQPMPVKVTDIIGEIADFIQLETRRHGIGLRYEVDAALPEVLADRIQIQQVIINLIRNAIEAMETHPGGCQLLLRAIRHNDAQLEITVQDTGPGLSSEAAQRIFHPFFTTKLDGLGLGLSISQSIVQAHGGKLWATSNAGSGATFHFTLPLAA